MNIEAAENLARELMNDHGLEDWTFGWDRATSRYGMTSYARKHISLSKSLTNVREESDVRNTLLHEIAHALVGAGHGHGPAWRAKAHSLGMTRTADASDAVKSLIDSVAKYSTKCPVCGTEYSARRRLSSFSERWCEATPECRRVNSVRENRVYLVWFENTKFGPVKVD